MIKYHCFLLPVRVSFDSQRFPDWVFTNSFQLGAFCLGNLAKDFSNWKSHFCSREDEL